MDVLPLEFHDLNLPQAFASVIHPYLEVLA